MRLRLTIAASALAVAAALGGADALARGGRGKAVRTRTVRLARPAGAPDADAQGTVRYRVGRKGLQATLRASRLAPRTAYEVRDARTGGVLGTATTDRRGRARLEFGKELARDLRKSAAASGSEETTGEVVVVDPTSGDTVLGGDVVLPTTEPLEGSEMYRNEESGDAAFASLYASPETWLGYLDGEEITIEGRLDVFSFEFMPIASQYDEATGQWWMHTLRYDAVSWRGDVLPFGVSSAAELVGRAFEVRDGGGAVLLSGRLPRRLKAVPEQPWNEELLDDAGLTVAGGDPAAARGDRRPKAAKAGAAEGPFAGCSLWLADAAGDLQFLVPLADDTFAWRDDQQGAGDNSSSNHETKSRRR